jgi:hypothetical protein
VSNPNLTIRNFFIAEGGTKDDADTEADPEEEETSIASWIERLDASSPNPHPFLKNLAVRRKDIELKELKASARAGGVRR